MSLYSSLSRPFPATPGKGTHHLRDSINNTAGLAGSGYSGTTPNRRATLTPRRSLLPSPLPEASSSQAGPSSSQYSNATSSFPPLKHRIAAHDPQLKAIMEQDAANVDATLKGLRDGKSERRRKHEGTKVELLEEERWWENECERLRKDGAQIVKTLEREKAEVADASSIVTSLENRKRALAAQVDALKADITEWQARIATRRDFNTQEKAAYEQQASKDRPELDFFSDVLGLRLQGKPKDVVSFRFSNLDSSDHRRAFNVDLDASSSSYTISLCQPVIPTATLQPLLNKLNKTRDLYTFIKEAREAFVQIAEAENRDKGSAFAR